LGVADYEVGVEGGVLGGEGEGCCAALGDSDDCVDGSGDGEFLKDRGDVVGELGEGGRGRRSRGLRGLS
jgi:hypothetical protein